MLELARYRNKTTQSGFFVLFRTEMVNVGMLVPALVSWMPMLNYTLWFREAAKISTTPFREYFAKQNSSKTLYIIHYIGSQRSLIRLSPEPFFGVILK
jgi:hypothetical protein